MVYLFLRHHIEDFRRWKEGFDIHLAARQAGGATHEALLLRNVDDPQEIIVILGWNSLTQAKLFTQSVSWQMARQQMGVIGVAEVLFLEEVG
jgi:hypothetical protein